MVAKDLSHTVATLSNFGSIPGRLSPGNVQPGCADDEARYMRLELQGANSAERGHGLRA